MTHFIAVWKDSNGTRNSSVYSKDIFSTVIRDTAETKVIAVFKIRAK